MEKRKRFILRMLALLPIICLVVIFTTIGTSKSYSQEEQISFSAIIPENYISKKDLSNLSKSINIPLNTTFYNREDLNNIKFDDYEDSADVIIARNYILEEAIYEERVARLDNSLISNIGLINPQFLKSAYDQGRKFSVPITWGGIGILYRKNKFDKPPATWRWLLDSDKYSGRIALISDGRTLIQIALKYIGISANSNDPSWINQAEGLLKRQKEHIKNFGGDNGIALILNDEVDLAIANNEDALKAMKQDSNIGFVFPREGSLIWQDIICISEKSNNKESAHYFINAVLDAEIGRNIAINNNLAPANLMSFDLLKDNYKSDARIFPDEQIMERYEDTSIILDFDYEMMIDEMWDNILDS
ncbi:MAG: spermidine/putrescine ABC transporter substrate-binding protein [Pseudomonadota bacterium]|nr:spermidine/putrescine ABC transporter substrate-binding protein [Pseudomonadota bacterium]